MGNLKIALDFAEHRTSKTVNLRMASMGILGFRIRNQTKIAIRIIWWIYGESMVNNGESMDNIWYLLLC